jgi:hypothetical protein
VCLLELFDATYIYNIDDFVSMCMMALTTGINFDLPHIPVLNKIDVGALLRSCSGTTNREMAFWMTI